MSKSHRTYLDHAATTPVRPEVLSVMLPVFGDQYGNPSSFHTDGQIARGLLDEARATIASCIGAKPAEIFFTSGGSEADNWAIKGAAYRLSGKGRHLITSAIEHHAVLHAMDALKRQGFDITVLPVDADGIVDPESVRKAIRPDTILVSIMMANNEIGTIEPIAEIGQICREAKVLFHTDAVQAAGALPIDVRTLNVDLMSFSGHKLYAPKGVGFLYIRSGVRIDNLIDGGGQERGRRAGTENLPSIVGMAKAFELATAELEDNTCHVRTMRDALIDSVLERIPHTRLNGHRTRRLPNNANFSFEFIEGESILLMLDHFGFECSSGSACTSGPLDPSHVLLAIGLPHEIAHGSLRVTFGKSNSVEDVPRLVDTLVTIIDRLRQMSPLYEAYLKQHPLACPAGAMQKDT